MLLPFFQWCENTGIGEAIRTSLWLFPVVESFHLVALSVIGGAILVVDMRLLGLGLKRQPAGQLARDVQPWMIGSLAVMLTSGIALFLSESIKCYYSDAFWVKMTALFLATAFTFTIRRRVVVAADSGLAPGWQKAVAIVSLTLWSAVGWAGRWIGFS